VKLYQVFCVAARHWAAPKLLICQFVVIWNVVVGFNNCHMSDMTDHLTQCQWPALVMLVFLLQLPLLQRRVVPSRYIIYINYMKFEEQIIGTF